MSSVNLTSVDTARDANYVPSVFGLRTTHTTPMTTDVRPGVTKLNPWCGTDRRLVCRLAVEADP